MSFNEEDEEFDQALKADFNTLRQDYKKSGIEFLPQRESHSLKVLSKKNKISKWLIPSIGLPVAAAITLAILYLPLGQGSQPTGKKIAEAKITFLRGQVKVNEQRARLGQSVKAGDNIQVAKKSGAVVQFGKGALISLSSNTAISVNQLLKNNKLNVHLSQRSGSTFSKIIPGRAKYQISSPTAVAGVRGTSFQMKMNGKKDATITLLKGKVTVKNQVRKSAKEVKLTKGKKVTINSKSGKQKVKKLNKKEKQVLKGLNQITFVTAPEKLNANVNARVVTEKVVPIETIAIIETASLPKQKKENKAATKTEAKAKKLTLTDLRAKYGKLTKIITKDNKTYIGGNWRQVENSHYIQTVNGLRKVPTSKVERVLPVD